MTKNKFIRKNAVKYTAAIVTSLYAFSLISPQVVKAIENTLETNKKIEEKNTNKKQLSVDENELINKIINKTNEEEIYTRTFDNSSDIDDYRVFMGEPSKLLVEDGVLKIANALYKEVRVVDEKSPLIKNGEYEFTAKMSKSGQFAAVFRFIDDNNYGMIGYDGGNWVLQSASDWKPISGPTLQAGQEYKIKIKYVKDKISVYINDNLEIETSLDIVSNFPMEAGKIGFRLWSTDKELHFDNVSYKAITGVPGDIKEREILEEDKEFISSENLQVTIDNKFPNVVNYAKGDKNINGTSISKESVKINKEEMKPEVTFNKESESKAVYTLDFNEYVPLTFDIAIEVIDNYVDIRLENVVEGEEFFLKTIEFKDHDLVSINSEETLGELTSAKVWGRNSSGDYYYNIKDKAIDNAPVKQTMTFINNGELSAGIENNVIDYSGQVQYKTTEKEGKKNIGLWNGTWIYREVEDKKVTPVFNGDLYSRVIIADDINEDNIISWEDVAIAYRDVMEKPEYNDMVRDKVSHIAMNFASQAQYPFERLVDQVAKYSNYIDGFGQMLLLKGYQSEGHDSAHPDYGNNFNERAGGLKGFNSMTETVEDKYNTKIGVHINATEAYPEAKYFSNELLQQPMTPGWAWLDQAYLIDKRKDILNHSETGLNARLREMQENAPGIDWVYVDTYWSNPWNEHKVEDFLLENKFAVATEYSGPFKRNSIWTHWADIQHGNNEYSRGLRSEIVRFVENEMRDVFPSDIHLMGAKHTGYSGWQNEKNLDETVKQFYTWELPTKYMQNFAITNWSDEEVKFENELVSKVTNLKSDNDGVGYEGNHELYKDGNLIYSSYTYKSGSLKSRDNRVFVPWGEDVNNPDKVYAWNDFKESKEWNVPATWANASEVYLYKTDGTGRTLLETIPVVEGKIELNLQDKTPYVVYKDKVENTTDKTKWSETSLVRDNGFNSYSFKDNEEDSYGWWTPSSSNGKIDNIYFEEDKGGSAGQTYLKIDGINDGRVSQEIKLEGGKHYSASVWAEVSDKSEKRAELEIVFGNGEKYSHYLDLTTYKNNIINTDKRGTRFQRIKVDFYLPEGENLVTMNLKAGEGKDENSYVRFDNARITEHKKSELEIEKEKEHLYFEDFETVDEGWGPFTQATGGECMTHLSETHEGYTNDTIDGEFSLKTRQSESGLVMKTSPGLLKFDPQKKYKVTFDYKFIEDNAKYDLVVRTDAGGKAEEKMDIALPAYEGEIGKFEIAFKTGDFEDYFVGFERKSGTLIIDNFTVDEYEGEVPDYIPEGIDKTMINPSSIKVNASSEETQSENGAASNASDLDESTIWHSRYSAPAEKPHYLTLELDKTYKINKLRYVPRQSGSNGNITEYKVLISNDGVNFNEVSTGNLQNNNEEKFITFEEVEAKYVKLEVLNSVGDFASAAEVNVYKVEETPEIIVKPGKIESLKANETTNNSITISWKKPSIGGEIKEYVIYKDGVEVERVPSTSTTYTLESLKSNTLYNIKVVAIDKQDQKSRPVAINGRTLK
ncbi:endo-alpha-N-acetylgalactosaminidase family protein [Clostridium tarantellae]|uniref:O-GlcNAcase NagJ n=1 Tax=Clostridium tarantellae TaxID=39493 RepID=A0A6I1MN61_9CLOT|nr:endo-alpha-N-acetylgalactosaminidase family protein [Clostridium tarantellae]MPQ43682.1 O-GlcNAcase NagJ [Clostridium tarantellae]